LTATGPGGSPRLSIVVPVFNEEAQLQAALENLVHSPCPIEREWIVVNDASTDRSGAILDELADTLGLRVIHQERNQGKGAAVIRGFREVTGDFVMIHDADFEYDPRDIPSLLEPLCRGEADVVYGSRFRKEATQVHRTYHYMVNRFLTALSNLMSGIYLTDMETCYKVFRTDLLRAMQLQSQRFGIEVELTAYVAKTRARVYERPIRYYPRTRLQGKKINWKDGVAALFHLVRFNLLTSRENAFRDLPVRYLERPAEGGGAPAPVPAAAKEEEPCPPQP
jgi:glycosyltransferase involved in cell wall biosynthesis